MRQWAWRGPACHGPAPSCGGPELAAGSVSHSPAGNFLGATQGPSQRQPPAAGASPGTHSTTPWPRRATAAPPACAHVPVCPPWPPQGLHPNAVPMQQPPHGTRCVCLMRCDGQVAWGRLAVLVPCPGGIRCLLTWKVSAGGQPSVGTAGEGPSANTDLPASSPGAAFCTPPWGAQRRGDLGTEPAVQGTNVLAGQGQGQAGQAGPPHQSPAYRPHGTQGRDVLSAVQMHRQSWVPQPSGSAETWGGGEHRLLAGCPPAPPCRWLAPLPWYPVPGSGGAPQLVTGVQTCPPSPGQGEVGTHRSIGLWSSAQ